MSHGKNPCDNIGGIAKRLVANASLQSLREPIDTPEKMFLWCKNNIKGIRFVFVSQPDAENHVSELKDMKVGPLFQVREATIHMFLSISLLFMS